MQRSLRHAVGIHFAVLALLACLSQVPARAQTTLQYWDFENFSATNWRGWTADNGVWDVGSTTRGPGGARQGSQCASSGLTAAYPASRQSRLISPAVTLPSVPAGQSLQLGFWQWFSYDTWSTRGYGTVEVRSWNGTSWSAWVGASREVSRTSIWSYCSVDITDYAGQRIQIAFKHYGGSQGGVGWFIDEVGVRAVPDMDYNQWIGFEDTTSTDWRGWSADSGVWDIGGTVLGPRAAHQGSRCAGSGLSAPYPGFQDSRLVSAPVTLPVISDPNASIGVVLWTWFDFDTWSTDGYGLIEVSEWNFTSMTWSEWNNVSTSYYSGTSTGWKYIGTSFPVVSLTAYAGKRVRLALHHLGGSQGGTGWFVDDIVVFGPPALMSASPESAPAGSAATTITLTGTGFNSDCEARWNGAALATTYISPTQLTAVIPAGNLTTAGTYSITVVCPIMGEQTSNALPFTVTGGTGKAATVITVPNRTGAVGQTITLTATLTKSSDGAPLSGKALHFVVAGTPLSPDPTTNAAGVASIDYKIAEGLAGSQSVAVGFTEDAGYYGSSGSGTLSVIKADTAITVPNQSGVVGQTVMLTATLKRTTDNTPLSGKALHFTVTGTALSPDPTTNASGVASIDYKIAEGLVGSQPIVVTFTADANYNNGSGSGTLTVSKSDVVIVVPNQAGAVGQTVALTATLTRKSDNTPLSGKALHFTVAGTALSPDPTTNASGIASIDYKIAEGLVGSKPIVVTFAADANYNDGSGSGTLTVSKSDTALAVASLSGATEQTVNLTATLTRTTDGAALAAKSIAFTVDGTSAGSAATGADGVAKRPYAIPAAMTSGAHTIGASFAGDANYNSSSGSGTLTVTVATKLYVVDRTWVGGTAVPLKAYLYRKSDSFPLVGYTLSFFIDGTSIGTTKTETAGGATLNWVIDAGPATRVIRVDFAGDGTYGPCTGTGKLVVITYNTTLSAPDRSGELLEPIVMKGYLYRTPGSAPVVGKIVTFSVDSTTIGSATTNSSGRALITWTVPDSLAPGAHAYTVAWAGDAGYNPSSASPSLVISKGVSYLWLASRSVKKGTAAYIRAYLRRLPDYAWMPARTVTFALDGTPLGQGTTDASGMAAYLYNCPAGAVTGDHPMSAEFPGDDRYLPSGSEAILTVTL